MSKLVRAGLVTAVFTLGATAALAQGAKLKVGDPAPKMSVGSWVKGKPVNELESGKVYVVEFWATWCGPCRESIPHLTEMAKKFNGKATFAGISVYEHGSNTLKQVQDFVKQMGPKMDYSVAVDSGKADMANNWMEAAGQDGIPTAFVVGKDGTIQWIGHPMGGLEEVVDKVVAGTFDAKKAAQQAATAAAEEEKREAEFRPFQEAYQAKNYKGALKELDKLMAKHPEMETAFAYQRFNLMLKTDPAGAQAYGKKLASSTYKTNAVFLNGIAWAIVDPENPIKNPNYALAVEIAKKASALSKDQDAFTLDTLALAQYKNGQVSQAIATQTKAVALATKMGAKVPPATMSEMKARLAQFKAKK